MRIPIGNWKHHKWEEEAMEVELIFSLMDHVPGLKVARDNMWVKRGKLSTGWDTYWKASDEMFVLFSKLLKEEEDTNGWV